MLYLSANILFVFKPLSVAPLLQRVAAIIHRVASMTAAAIRSAIIQHSMTAVLMLLMWAVFQIMVSVSKLLQYFYKCVLIYSTQWNYANVTSYDGRIIYDCFS